MMTQKVCLQRYLFPGSERPAAAVGDGLVHAAQVVAGGGEGLHAVGGPAQRHPHRRQERRGHHRVGSGLPPEAESANSVRVDLRLGLGVLVQVIVMRY